MHAEYQKKIKTNSMKILLYLHITIYIETDENKPTKNALHKSKLIF